MVDHFLYSHNLNWLIVSFFSESHSSRLTSKLTCWLLILLTNWLTIEITDQIRSPISRTTDWLSDSPSVLLTDWLCEQTSRQPTDGLISVFLTDQLIEYHFPSHKGHLQQVNTHKQLLKRQFSLSKMLQFILTPMAILGFTRTLGAEWKIYCHTCKHGADQKLSRKTLEPMPRNREPAMHCRTIDSFATWRKQIDDTAKNNSLH